VEFIASPSDNNLPLICKGQVENFPERIAAFSLNVACKLIYLKNKFHSFLFLVLPAEMKIIDSTLLSNLTVGNDNLGEFECRTSISNPQAILTIIRQSNDGVKHSDIQYKTSSTYTNGINSIKFMVSFSRDVWCKFSEPALMIPMSLQQLQGGKGETPGVSTPLVLH
jgi:hypothetical protein